MDESNDKMAVDRSWAVSVTILTECLSTKNSAASFVSKSRMKALISLLKLIICFGPGLRGRVQISTRFNSRRQSFLWKIFLLTIRRVP